MLERRIDDYWNMGGDRDLSDSWTHDIGGKTLQMGIHGPGSGSQRSNRHPGLITCGQKYGKSCQRQRNEKKNKSGLSKNRSLTMPEGCEVFTSLIQQMRSSSKLLKKSAKKVGSSDASSYALQDQLKKVQGNMSHS